MLTLAFVLGFPFSTPRGCLAGSRGAWGCCSSVTLRWGGLSAAMAPCPSQPIRVTCHALKSGIVDHLDCPHSCPACLHQGRPSLARQAQNLCNKVTQGADPWPPTKLWLSCQSLEVWSAGLAGHCPTGGRAECGPCFALCMLRTWPGHSMPHATAPCPAALPRLDPRTKAGERPCPGLSSPPEGLPCAHPACSLVGPGLPPPPHSIHSCFALTSPRSLLLIHVPLCRAWLT